VYEDKREVQLELPLPEPTTQTEFVEMVYDTDKLKWTEMVDEPEEIDKLASSVDMYLPLIGGVIAGALLGASLAMWML
jgi:hypothetical protein